jgi:hypothetical protein
MDGKVLLQLNLRSFKVILPFNNFFKKINNILIIYKKKLSIVILQIKSNEYILQLYINVH